MGLLSFVIIGKNEEKNIARCLGAIKKSVDQRGLPVSDYEIVYVDSDSTDNSLLLLSSTFPEVRVVSLKGKCNAALGRNAGGAKAIGEILIFLDADIELIGFNDLMDAFQHPGREGILTGELTNVENGELVHRPSGPALHGATFVIHKKTWNRLGGMKTKYTTGEDYDLGLRAIEAGYTLTRIKKVVALHYTIPYLDDKRLWKDVNNKKAFYFRSVLLRDHFTTPAFWKILWNNEKTFLLLTACILLSIVFLNIWIFAGIYLAVIALRAYKNKHKQGFSMLLLYYIAIDFLSIYYLFTLWPADISRFDTVNELKPASIGVK